MRHFITFITLICLHCIAQGQNIPFGVEPSAIVTTVIPNSGANEVWMYFPNTSMDSILLHWRRIEVQKPTDWVIDLCDYGSCVSDVPPSGQMNWLAPQKLAYLKLIVQPKGVDGTAILRFRVALAQNAALYRDVQFEVRTQSVSIVQEPQHSTDLVAYPNPVQNELFVRFAPKGGKLLLLDNFGRLLEQIVLNTDQTECVFDMRLRQISMYHIIHVSDSGAQAVLVVR
jgi:hypothetical protein